MIYIVLSVILVACQVIILLFPLIYRMPLRFNAAALIALAFLGLHWLLYHNKTGIHVFAIILWVLIFFIGLIALPDAYVVLIGADRARNSKPVVFEEGKSAKAAAIVYHPGGSGFQKKISTLIAGRLSGKGIKATLYTAGPDLKINPKDLSVLILISPVYGSKPRPPFIDFINNADLKGVKCYVVLCGWFTDMGPEMKETMKSRMKQLIESRGGLFTGYQKFSSFTSDLKSEADSLSDNLSKL